MNKRHQTEDTLKKGLKMKLLNLYMNFILNNSNNN